MNRTDRIAQLREEIEQDRVEARDYRREGFHGKALSYERDADRKQEELDKLTTHP